jgi:hypothetical protein
MEEMRIEYKNLIEKRKGKSQLGIHRRGWENTVEMGLREVKWGRVEWIHLAQGSNSGDLL